MRYIVMSNYEASNRIVRIAFFVCVLIGAHASGQSAATTRQVTPYEVQRRHTAVPIKTERMVVSVPDPRRSDISYELYHSVSRMGFATSQLIPEVSGWKVAARHHDGRVTTLINKWAGLSQFVDPFGNLAPDASTLPLHIVSIHAWNNRRVIVYREGRRTGVVLLEVNDEHKMVDVLFRHDPENGLERQRLDTIATDRLEVTFDKFGVPTIRVIEENGSLHREHKAVPPLDVMGEWEWIPHGEHVYRTEREKVQGKIDDAEYLRSRSEREAKAAEQD
jgi:hypothetical protein